MDLVAVSTRGRTTSKGPLMSKQFDHEADAGRYVLRTDGDLVAVVDSVVRELRAGLG